MGIAEHENLWPGEGPLVVAQAERIHLDGNVPLWPSVTTLARTQEIGEAPVVASALGVHLYGDMPAPIRDARHLFQELVVRDQCRTGADEVAKIKESG